MSEILISIGNFEIRWYSILIVLGLIIGYFGVNKEAKRFNINKDFLINVIFWAIFFGIIGARIYYVVFNWNYYSHNLNEIYKIWNGGLAIYGGIIVGAITTIIYSKKYKFSFSKILDIFAPFLLLAQAIGRWGNFFNQEAYGSIVSYAKLKSLYIPEFIINGMKINGNYYLPMFYFESIWCILGVIFLLIIRRLKKLRNGQIVSIYLIWYSLGRFFIEIFRTDSLLIGNIKVAQIVSILLFLIGLAGLIAMVMKKENKFLYNRKER